MKTESSHGIILRTRPLTETSLIVHWLTPELGRLATVAKGARRPKSPFAGKLDMSSQSIAYAALVTAASADNICGPMLRVKPGDHANSTMWVRMSPTATGCGTGTVEKMPFGLAALPQAQIDAVAAWIDAGAAE